MRHLLVSLSLVLAAACGGGKPKPTTQPAGPEPGAEPAPSQFARDYCDSYRGCAEEQARYGFEGEEPDEATLAEAVQSKVETCLAVTSGLTPGQEAWLGSCTGCGGSCDIYDCMDRIPTEAEPAAFECDLGDPEPEPEPEG